MAELTKADRRRNRKHVLEALHDETGSWGGDAAADRVKAYCKDPEGASKEQFAYVGAMVLRRFYVDPAKPNASERRSLWKHTTDRIGHAGKDPGGWDADTNVSQLQAIVEES